MTTTTILAVIGGIAVILTAAAHIPAALAEFLRACSLVANAAWELRAALNNPASRDEPGKPVARIGESSSSGTCESGRDA
jgi:hypothetical protein